MILTDIGKVSQLYSPRRIAESAAAASIRGLKRAAAGAKNFYPRQTKVIKVGGIETRITQSKSFVHRG
jgi:hypothetical protein